ncbi:unnamed protein product [Spirodela intermedia]|uniref:Uncharacterized protein n=1 Tax=Spirodela intermedia TaxID=51605 RepID=A0A7I8J7Y1_SPIIN|nr:unnamed protein product [Spirodela intermedia]CAA6666184.1 unnamed protein product [Spirodela intermedia]
MIGEPADPSATVAMLPEWYLFPVLGVLLMVSIPAGLLTVPFLGKLATSAFLIGLVVTLPNDKSLTLDPF